MQPNSSDPLPLGGEEYGCLLPGQYGKVRFASSITFSIPYEPLSCSLTSSSCNLAFTSALPQCLQNLSSNNRYLRDMVHQSSPSQTRKEHRWLRVTTILAFIPTFALLLPYGIISARPLPTIGIAAMFFSAGFSTLVLGGGVRSPGIRACVDLLLAISILVTLIPR